MSRRLLSRMDALALVLLCPVLAHAGIGDPIVDLIREAVAAAKSAFIALLGGYILYVGYKWYTAAQDAQRHTLYALVGGVVLYNVDSILAALGGGA